MKMDIGDPFNYQNLTLIPLAGSVKGEIDYISATDAMDDFKLLVAETEEPVNIQEISVTSTSDKMILLLDCEALIGARKNRVPNTTSLIPAKVHKLKIPVTCVEKDRWSYKSRKFSSGHYAPPMVRSSKSFSVYHNLRETGQLIGDQDQIWNDIKWLLDILDVPSPTKAMNDIVNQRLLQLCDFVEELEYPPGTRGVAAVVNGKLAALDLFDKPDILENIWNRLVTSYAVEALSTPASDHGVADINVQALLNHISKVHWDAYPGIAIGQDMRFQDTSYFGQAHVFADVCVHLSVFPMKNPVDNRTVEPQLKN